MTLRQSLQLTRRWWWVIMAGATIGVVVGWLSAPGSAPVTTTFEATHTLIFEPGTPGIQIRQAAALTTLGGIPDRVAARLRIDPGLVRSSVSAETPANVGTLLIRGRSGESAQAEALADVTAEELIVELGGEAAPLRTLEPAVVSPVTSEEVRGPTSRPGRAGLLGAFGLLLGVGATFVVDRFDDRIRSKRAAEDTLGAPVVAEVPPVPRSARHRLLTANPPLPFVDAHRRLRTAVVRWSPPREHDDGRRVIVVTSLARGEGKTTTVAHLAMALAEARHRVLLISGDLRRPRLHLYFDRPRDPGLGDVLAGGPRAPALAELDLSTAIPGIYLLPSGPPVDNPAPLLEQVGDLVDAARGACRFVLIDSPPLLMASEAAHLAGQADGVLLVVRAGYTSTREARRSAELLHRLGIPVLGAVLAASDTAPTLPRPEPTHDR